jgi:hypothetical protein
MRTPKAHMFSFGFAICRSIESLVFAGELKGTTRVRLTELRIHIALPVQGRSECRWCSERASRLQISIVWKRNAGLWMSLSYSTAICSPYSYTRWVDRCDVCTSASFHFLPIMRAPGNPGESTYPLFKLKPTLQMARVTIPDSRLLRCLSFMTSLTPLSGCDGHSNRSARCSCVAALLARIVVLDHLPDVHFALCLIRGSLDVLESVGGLDEDGVVNDDLGVCPTSG